MVEGKRMSTGALVALTAVSAGMSIVQGLQQNSASTEASRAYYKEAQVARAENELAIQQKQREIDKVSAQQVMAMAKNGMNTGMGGTPLQILQETAFLGQQEVDALRRQGEAQVGYYSALGKQQLNNGRTAVLGGWANALTTVATVGVKMKSNGLLPDAPKTEKISWGKSSSGFKIGSTKSGKVYAGLSTGMG